jgi:hypothetical protein
MGHHDQVILLEIIFRDNHSEFLSDLGFPPRAISLLARRSQ